MEWVAHTLPSARQSVSDTSNRHWLRCGGTWFAGVNILPNHHDGSVNASGPLSGDAVRFVRHQLSITDFVWDQGQLSICYPGYPQPMEGESPAAFRFRREYHAAHVDGLLPQGERRRRHLREHHGFILGIPLVEFGAGASPFSLWEGSHEMVRNAFADGAYYAVVSEAQRPSTRIAWSGRRSND